MVTQESMRGRARPAAISKYLKKIYESGELAPATTISRMETVQSEGGRQVARVVEFYNLDAVIAIGRYALLASQPGLILRGC